MTKASSLEKAELADLVLPVLLLGRLSAES